MLTQLAHTHYNIHRIRERRQILKKEAQERHRIKTRLPRTAEKMSGKKLKSQMNDLGVELESDDEVRPASPPHLFLLYSLNCWKI